MKYLLTLLFLSLAIGLSSCSSAETEKKEIELKPEVAQPKDEGVEPKDDSPKLETEVAPPLSKDAKASQEEIEAKSAAQTGLGPTDTLRAFNDAVSKNDAAKIKSFLSRGSIRLFENEAKMQGKKLDDVITLNEGAPMPAEQHMQNEAIDGDNATVEILNSALGSYDKMYLIKEDGNWRVALDKFQKEMIKKLNDLQKDAPTIK